MSSILYQFRHTCAPFLKSFFSTSGNMCSEYLPFPCGPGSKKLVKKRGRGDMLDKEKQFPECLLFALKILLTSQQNSY